MVLCLELSCLAVRLPIQSLLFFLGNHRYPAGFEVLRPAHIETDHPHWQSAVAQKFSHGRFFTMDSLPSAPLEMLHAFSHFTYSRSGGLAVVVDFQGSPALITVS